MQTLQPVRLDDAARLSALRGTRLLDTPPEEAFDRLTRLAARILGAPVVLINLVEADRQFFKSRVGPEEPPAAPRPAPGSPVFHSFCRHVVTSGAPLAVPDARQHPLVRDGVVIPGPGVVAYVGVPLVTSDGKVLGSFCAIDSRPRDWVDADVGVLRDLAAAAMTEIELRAEVAKRRRLEDESREREHYLRVILDSQPECVKTVAPDGSLIDMNAAGLAMIEAESLDVVRGACVFPIAAPEHREAYERLHRRALDGEAGTLEFEIVGLRGTRRWLEISSVPLRDDSGAVVAVLSVTRDETERRAVEAERRAALERLEALVRLSPLAIISLDPQQNVTGWNPAAERIFGWRAEEILGRPYPLFAPDQRPEFERVRRATFEAGGVDGIELRRWRRDGSAVDCYLSTTVVRDGAGRVVGSVGFYSDVTERRQLEEQLRQSQKMEAVGQLAGGVAHDFNNLLTIIIGHSDLLLGSVAVGDPRREDVEEIRRASIRAAALTRQLLAFGRKQLLSPRVLDLNAVILGLEPMLGRLIGEDIRTIVTPGADLWPVLADQGQLEQVAVNLAVNARDAMPRGGSLIVSTANLTLDHGTSEHHGGVPPGEYVVLSVTDTGVGMDAATLKRAFEPFFTTKPVGQGTGLGLATVYGIVTQSGGQVRCESTPEKGTTVRVYLRRADPLPASAPGGSGAGVADAPAPRSRGDGEAAAGRGGATVLVVEDEAGVRRLATRTLAGEGYRVLEAADGREALELVRAHHGPLDLVLTDAVMPGMSGSDLATALGALRPGVRHIFMSGYTDDEIVRRGLLEPGAAFLQKPFTPDALARVVVQALARSG